MKIIITAMMGPGTLEAKLKPLINSYQVEEIIFIRKSRGPTLEKVRYIELPKICSLSVFHVFLTPLILFFSTVKNKPNLLISYHIIPYAFFAYIIGKLTQTPYIVCQTGIQIENTVKTSKVLSFFVRRIMRSSFQVNVPGKQSKYFWKNSFPLIKSKFEVLHSTISTELYIPDHTVKPVYELIFLGRLHQIKNVDLIIEAVHKFNSDFGLKYKVQIVGSGPEEENIKQLVCKFNLCENVRFQGFVDDPEQYLRESKFLLMASSSEGLPTAMMQAMSCGVIPITNLVGNISDIIRDGDTGITFDKLNSNAIVNALRRAHYLSQNDLKEIKENCRQEIIKNHSHIAAEKKWNEVYKKLKNQ